MKNIAIITGATGGPRRAFTRQLIEYVDEVWAIGRSIQRLKYLLIAQAQRAYKVVLLLQATAEKQRLLHKALSQSPNTRLQ